MYKEAEHYFEMIFHVCVSSIMKYRRALIGVFLFSEIN